MTKGRPAKDYDENQYERAKIKINELNNWLCENDAGHKDYQVKFYERDLIKSKIRDYEKTAH